MIYRPEIDGLRAVAVLPVLFFHAGVGYLPGGYVGVDVFFVISGYLITSILLEEMSAGTFSIGKFYERRVRRLLPALFAVLFVSTPVALSILLPSDLVDFGESLIAVPLFVSNFLFWSERGYFGVAGELKPLIHTWSLAVEEQFYIAFPLFLAALVRFWSKFVGVAFGLVLISSLVVSWYLTKLHFETAFFLPMARAWELMLGALIAYYAIPLGRVTSKAPNCASLLGIGLIATAIVSFDVNTPFPGLAALVPTFGAALLIASPSDGNRVHAGLSNSVVVFVGLISYPLYLWHQPIFAFARHADVNESTLLLFAPIAFVLAVLTYYFIERPFREKGKVGTGLVFRGALIVSLVSVATGSAIVLNKGFLSRFHEADQVLLRQFAELDGYNQARFDALEGKFFQNDHRRKILLVGDSHAKDFLNVIAEGPLGDHVQFSTRQVNSECGLVLTRGNIDKHIPVSRAERCRVMGRFEGETFNQIASASDEIWLSASWLPWVVEHLPETIRDLQDIYGKPVLVVGPKAFGSMRQKVALSVPKDDRAAYVQAVPDHIKELNSRVKALVKSENFVELLEVFCRGSSGECHSFTPAGELVSPDGGHLTQAGARFLSEQMISSEQKNSRVRNLIEAATSAP